MSAARTKRRARSPGPRVENGTRDARRTAMLILEVLGGHRTPTDAARELSVSVTRYDMLEKQGLEGRIEAVEPKARGPKRSSEKQVAALERKVAALERECARRQSLLRLSQRALGIRQAKEPERKPGARKPKRATVRALKAASQLDGETISGEEQS